MANLKFFIDADKIASEFGDLKSEVEQSITEAVKALSSMTHARTVEIASQELNSTRDLYLKNLSYQEVQPGLWVVALDQPAMWLEEGRKCVVYGKNKSHVPKVLTPDGEILITSLKKGMLVLNKNGKWTKVLEVYDEHLVEKSNYKWHFVLKSNYCPTNKKLHKRKNLDHVLGICVKCNFQVKYSKWNSKLPHLRCTNCLVSESVYQIHLGSWSKTKSGTKNHQFLTVTGDHKIWTNNGWKQARDLDSSKDTVFVPSWTKCEECGKPAYMGRNYCYDALGGSCSTTLLQKKLLKNGKHPSQNPSLRAKYIEKLKKAGKKGNFCEETLAKKLIELGYSVGSVDEGKDWIREFPVICDDNGKKRCFYLDFYSPKLKLGIEVDGAAFHTKERDSKRDALIKKSLNLQIVRVPAKKVLNKNFKTTTLDPICKNHENNIEMLPAPWFKVSRVKLKKFSDLNRRWDITVENGASFVCAGIVIHNSGDMTEDLLRNNAKVSKDGSRYKVIPFEHSKPSSQNSESTQKLVNSIRGELRKRGIPFKGIEKNADGSPRVGKLHTINMPSTPYPSSRASSPVGMGVNIYQTKTPAGTMRRDIMTFRVVSDKHKGSKWIHPGREASKFMDQALEWSVKHFDEVVLPEILKRFE